MLRFFLTIGIVLSGAGILLTVFPQWNYALFKALNHTLSHQAWLMFTNMADFRFLGCILFILLFPKPVQLTNALIAATLIHYSIKYSKIHFGILRPEYRPDVVDAIRIGSGYGSENYAMPSGHTASAFMAIVLIAQAYRLGRWKLAALFIYGIAIAFSRIAVGVHWPADVCAGAATGAVLALMCNQLHFQYRYMDLVNLCLCLPFIALAIYATRNITDMASLLSEGVLVIAGLAAAIVWIKACGKQWKIYKSP